ncbi:MAG: transporter substrate-binding domain-containing protein [Chloroflexota bacterium]
MRLKNRIKQLIALLGLLLLLLLPGQAAFAQAVHLRVGLYQNPPLSFSDDDGVAQGLVVDILRAIAQEEHWQLEFVPCEWTQCLEMLASGQIDLMGAIAYTEARTERFDFNSEAYFVNWGTVYTRSGITIQSLLELDGLTIAAVNEDVYTLGLQDLLTRLGIESEFIAAQDYAQAFAMVQSGAVDAGVVARLYGVLHEADYQLEQSPIIYSPITLRYAATKGQHTAILETIDTYLGQWKSEPNSPYNLALNQWLESQALVWKPPWWLPWVFGGLLAWVGLLFGAVAILRARVRAQTASLSESEQKFRGVVRQASDGIALTDEQGRLIEWNTSMQAVTGIEAIEVLGQPIWEVQHRLMPAGQRTPEGLQKLKEVLLNAVRTGDLPRSGEIIEREYDHPDGSHRHLQGSIFPIKTARGFMLGSLSRDISAQKHAQETIKAYSEKLEEMVADRTQELRAAQEQIIIQERLAALGQVAAGVAHELRNPHSVISNAVYYLRSIQPDADPKVKEYIDIIESEGWAADKIVTDLLDYSHLPQPDPEPLIIAEIVQQALDKTPLPGQVSLSTQYPAHLPEIFADPRMVTQALGNLILNACQAMPAGGALSIQAEKRAGKVAIAITDTGEGIPAANNPRLFEPLYTTRARGIGMGLPIARKLVEANGGRIEVRSKPGKGSTFTVILPVSKEKK